MLKKLVVVMVGVAVGVVLVAGGALADDESDRVDLIKNIDDRLDRMASELSGFDSDRDAGDLDDALSYAREVRDMVGKLERVKGSDSRANEMVSRYPGYVDTFREAARYLKKMKELQFLADGVADRCKSDESDLQTLIRNYVGRPDVQELMKKVRARTVPAGCPVEPSFALHDRVVIRLADGRLLDSGPIRFARGHAQMPLSDDELETKFRSCAGEGDSRGVEDLLNALRQVSDRPESALLQAIARFAQS